VKDERQWSISSGALVVEEQQQRSSKSKTRRRRVAAKLFSHSAARKIPQSNGLGARSAQARHSIGKTGTKLHTPNRPERERAKD